MRKPRKLKKQIKNGILIYDLASCPKNMTMEKVVYAYQQHGLVIYNSQSWGNVGGLNIPYPPTLTGRARRVRFKDLGKPEVKE